MERKKRKKSIVEEVFLSSFATYVMATLAYAVGPMVDGAVIGRVLGADAFAAYGLIWPAVLVYSLVGGILAGGARNLYVERMGKGRLDEANEIFTAANVVSALISIILLLVTVIFADSLVGMLGARGELEGLRPLAKAYLFGFVLGVPVMNAAKINSSFMQIDGDGKRTIYSVVWMTAADIIGDLFTAFVLRGGMFAIGISTSLGNLLYLLILLLHFCRKDRLLYFRKQSLRKMAVHTWDILKNGIPSGVTRLAGTFGGLAVNQVLASHAGAAAAAAYGVHKSMGILISAIYLGAADTVWMLSGVYFGEEDADSLKELQEVSARKGLFHNALAGGLILIFASFFASIYLDRAAAAAFPMAVEAVRCFAVSLPLYLLVYCFDDYLMGVQRLTFANIYGFLLECGVLVPVVNLMVYFFGERGIWMATPVSLVVMAGIGVLYIVFQKGEGGFSEKRILLPSAEHGTEIYELSMEAYEQEDVISMSRQMKEFCSNCHLGSRKAFLLSLFIEEMGCNIIKHGFEAGKEQVIRIRVFVKNGDLTLRITDDCRPFNPRQYYDMLMEQPEDPEIGIGIRMVIRMSQSFQYLTTFRLNNLVIKI